MKVNIPYLVVRIVGMFAVFACALFIPAGTVAWPAGWVFLTLFFGFTIAISAWLVRNNPGLLTERMTGLRKTDREAWDRVLLLVTGIAFFAWLVLISLDAARFHWSLMPTWLQVVGTLLLLTSFYIFFLTFSENSYLSPAVRVQVERGQTVISTGPYRYVRHPMYAAFLLYIFGTSFLLGSCYGLVGALVLVAALARRAVLEERTLREKLEGYDAYMHSVGYRFIPHVW